MNIVNKYLVTFLLVFCSAFLAGCGSSGGSDATSVVADDDGDDGAGVDVDDGLDQQGDAGTPGILHAAFSWFGANVTVALDGNEAVVEATGRPDHASAYWDPGNSSGLYIDPDPAITTVAQMSPGYIEEYSNLYTLRVPTSPGLAAASSATTLGAVGIAVSGAPIFNDQEGPNVDLEIGVISGFDRSGGHTGPETYHYHLEPTLISNDDAELIGVIADGFFIYGRQCYSTPGTYPTDLDESGGHLSMTQHSSGEEEYHYHIKDEPYLGSYYLLFPENYQGTPNSISR